MLDITTQLNGGDDNIGINNQRKVHDGELTRILTGQRPFPQSIHGHPRRLKFRPGALNVSHAEALRHCFVNATHYARHIFDRPTSVVSLSDPHKLMYLTIPKSSSSVARHAVRTFFAGRDRLLKHEDMEEKVRHGGYSLVSFIRRPLERFYSSYDEAFYRMGPWKGDGATKQGVREQYLKNKHRIAPYPYLYEGLTTLNDFRRMYCPQELLVAGQLSKCNEVPSVDNGTLARRFQRFVRDYSGLDPFDVHLHLQVGHLVLPTGTPLPVTVLYNATEAEKGWQEIARQRGVTVAAGTTQGRGKPRRFNTSLVAEATKRKICRLLALDYCCLNLELPVECRGKEGQAGGVFCAMERRNNDTMKYAVTPLVIHAWRDPQL